MSKTRFVTILVFLICMICFCLLKFSENAEAFAMQNSYWSSLGVDKQQVNLMQGSGIAPFGKYTETVNGVQFELARIPTGTFLMGNAKSPNPEEKPAHQVSVRSFFLGQYEVTREQWNMVADTLPKIQIELRRQFIGQILNQIVEPTTPADSITWDEAVEFCSRLTRRTGRTYRLPTEAEWEYACRAGTQSEFSFGDQFDPRLANMEFVSEFMLPVGKLGYANNWGLFDMHGNVTEWTQDHEHRHYNGAPTDGSAWTQGGNSTGRLQRGGRYRSKPETGRSASRFFSSIYLRYSGDGLRLAADIPLTFGTGQVVVASAASYSNDTLAAGSIAALFGNTLSTFTQTASALPLPFTLAGASVNLKDSSGNEYLAPLFFASSGQINFLIPSGLALGRGTVSVVTNGNIHSTGPLEIANVNPGLFAANATGKDVAAALALRVKSNGEQVYEPVAAFDASSNRFVPVAIDLSNPNEQVFLVLFGTGFRNRTSLSNTSAMIGGQSAEVLFAGAQGDLVGLDQCNFRLSPNLAGRGDVSVSITVDGQSSNTVQIRIR